MYYLNFNDIPKNHYNVLYCDPPWTYGDKMRGHSFSVESEYQLMPLEWIRSLPVAEVAAKDSALLLWVPSPMLADGLDVMRRWGFKYVTVAFVWSKLTSRGKDVANLGRWTLGNVELCLLGRRGKIQRQSRTVRQLVRAVRGRHSEKPADVRSRIDTLFGEVPRIELFARGQTPGWDQFGNDPAGGSVADSQLAVPDVPEVDS